MPHLLLCGTHSLVLYSDKHISVNVNFCCFLDDYYDDGIMVVVVAAVNNFKTNQYLSILFRCLFLLCAFL